MIAPIAVAVALVHPAPGLDLRAHAAHHRRRPPLRVRRARHRRHLRARVVAWAASRIGMPYVWGATGPAAFDCSGLVQWSYRRIGRWLPRTTWSQRYAGGAVHGPLRRGDLVLSYADSHVAIYAGHGTVIVAPHTGDVVKREPLTALAVSGVRRIIRRG